MTQLTSIKSRLEQLKRVHALMFTGDTFVILGVEGLIRSLGIKACMHQGKQIENPTFFTDSIDNSCEYYMGQLLLHFENKSDWNTIMMDLKCISDYIKEVESK